MRDMFRSALLFNSDISDWDVGSVRSMDRMFSNATVFNSNINSWDTSSLSFMGLIFYKATAFNSDISNWDISKVTYLYAAFDSCGLSTENYDALLTDWSQQDVNSNLNFSAAGLTYCQSTSARQSLIDNHGWIITDAGLDCTSVYVDEETDQSISVYPNPTSGILNIQGNNKELTAVIFDILGKKIMSQSFFNEVDLSQLETGIYIIRISDGQNSFSQKIIKI